MIDFLTGTSAVTGAAFLGFVPVLVWLIFWLFEDFRHPEPRRLILFTFLAGACSVLLVIPIQRFFSGLLPLGGWLLLIWALIEEAAKFGAAWIVALHSRATDEPIDYPVYLITAALGFAAIENSLFLFNPLLQGLFVESAITGNLRFIGATLIHVLGSAVIGAALAFSFFRSTTERILYFVCGVILAVVLHALFNMFIVLTDADRILMVFLGVWVGIIFILISLERIKMLRPPAWWEKLVIPPKN